MYTLISNSGFAPCLIGLSWYAYSVLCSLPHLRLFWYVGDSSGESDGGGDSTQYAKKLCKCEHESFGKVLLPKPEWKKLAQS